jgi:NADH:ubiquinone reductase (non-electrogenic)
MRMLQATFGVPGVKEHCCFLKNVDDAITLRSRLVQQFEAASLPGKQFSPNHTSQHALSVAAWLMGSL